MPSLPQLTIRFADRDDAAAIVDFNRRLARETEGRDLDRVVLARGVAAVLSDPNLGFYLVAAVGDRVVGQLMITTEWSDWRDGLIWWFQSVYVDSDYRRRGVFRQLFTRVRDLATADPRVVGLRLYVEQTNRTALGAYRELGMDDSGYRVLELVDPSVRTAGEPT